ncbi:MAG: hypothetical protein OSB43_18435, partial [Nocardioides sp.]|uniref:hypothetical protein n=1 Tax=Nocardioides sp. TaxID=35761 RepID=UPI002386A114
GFYWGRSVFDVAARISEAAHRSEIDIAVTGRVGAAYLGVLGTSSPRAVWCWVHCGDRELADIAERLSLEPASEDSSNVRLSSDPWRLGVHRRTTEMLDDWSASTAHPVRVWCDLHSEPRGTEFAAQMWRMIGGG